MNLQPPDDFTEKFINRTLCHLSCWTIQTEFVGLINLMVSQHDELLLLLLMIIIIIIIMIIIIIIIIIYS